jgi:hypothetical protein
MFAVVKLFDQLKAGNASLLLVKGEHPEGELPKVWVHVLRKAFCPDTGTPARSATFMTWPILPAQRNNRRPILKAPRLKPLHGKRFLAAP